MRIRGRRSEAAGVALSVAVPAALRLPRLDRGQPQDEDHAWDIGDA